MLTYVCWGLYAIILALYSIATIHSLLTRTVGDLHRLLLVVAFILNLIVLCACWPDELFMLRDNTSTIMLWSRILFTVQFFLLLAHFIWSILTEPKFRDATTPSKHRSPTAYHRYQALLWIAWLFIGAYLTYHALY